MFETTITTTIDEIILYLRKSQMMSFSELSQKMNCDISVIERIILTLESKGIIKIISKNLEEYAKLIKDDKKEDSLDVFELKKDFISKAKIKNLPYEKIQDLWLSFVSQNEEGFKEQFLELKKTRFPKLTWQVYENKLREL